MVAALPIVITALVAILVLLAFWPLLRPVVELIGQAPLGIGAWLLRSSDAALRTAYVRVAGWAAWAVPPLAAIIIAPFRAIEFQFNNAGAAVHALFSAAWRLENIAIPRARWQAMSYANDRVAEAVGYAQGLFNNAIQFTTTLVAQAIEYAQVLASNAVTYAQALQAQAVQYTEALVSQAIHYAEALASNAVAYAQALQAQAIEYAQVLQAQALGFAEDAFGRAIEFEQRLYGEGIRFAEDVYARATDYARALSELSIAYTAATVGAVAVRVARIESSKCQRFCNPLGDLGEVLQDLQGLGVAALFLALAAEMARDPQGSARALDGALGPLLKEVSGAIRSEAGVR